MRDVRLQDVPLIPHEARFTATVDVTVPAGDLATMNRGPNTTNFGATCYDEFTACFRASNKINAFEQSSPYLRKLMAEGGTIDPWHCGLRLAKGLNRFAAV
jgi:hypothetical protein